MVAAFLKVKTIIGPTNRNQIPNWKLGIAAFDYVPAD
jgi:hypothetical protein